MQYILQHVNHLYRIRLFPTVSKSGSSVSSITTENIEALHKNIFSFVTFFSNTGGDSLAKHVVQNNARGYDRRDLRLKDMEEIVRTSSLHEPSKLIMHLFKYLQNLPLYFMPLK
jgi:hypothetical protein